MLILLVAPAIAHQVEIAGEVGGTVHIEPNDTPQAGEPSLTWFALTRQGGELIPLAACDCQLAVYAQPHSNDTPPVQEPPLRAVSAEGYDGIPGADITFPQVGAYELVLRGQPIPPEEFQPFDLRFSITVAAGQGQRSPSPQIETIESPSPAAIESPQPDPTQPERSSGLAWIVLSISLVASIAIGVLLRSIKVRRK
ncbi:MAG: hypothetical protein HC769_03995 [Cyanobacteria bacterium CRU_2_1]|nr:hypothetical protein [Cyanobacteria bacterium CRU_2_1]